MKKIILSFATLFIVAMGLLSTTSCSKVNNNELWVYTSMRQEEIDAFSKIIKVKFPEIDLHWYRNGSENIASRIAIEQMSGNVKANIVMTANYLWYEKMAKEGLWQAYKPNLSYAIPDSMKSPEDFFTVVRMSVMVLAYNSKIINEADAPKSFQDLTDPKWKGKITTASPLESGSAYSAVSSLIYKYGYDYLKKLRVNDVIASGGNLAALQRVESGECPISIIILENALHQSAKNPNIKIVYPTDGSILVPSPIAITKATKNMEKAKKLADFFLSQEAQKVIVDQGMMHSMDPLMHPPANSIALGDLMNTSSKFDEAYLSFARKLETEFKEQYEKIMLQ